MSRRDAPHHRASQRDRKIIDHVARYRISTNEVLHKFFFERRQPNAVSKVTARLCRAKLLARFTLCHPRSYLTLGPLAAQQLGIPLHRTYPLGPQSLPTEYAVLAYCSFASTPRVRLTLSELRQRCPWMPSPLLDFPYCLAPALDTPVLELIRVDLGGKPDHVARKCGADIQVRRPMPEFEQLVREGLFRLVIITGTTEKATAIRAALDEHIWPAGLQLHLAVVSNLLLLLGSTNDGP